MGTYAEPGWDRERELHWCEQPRPLHALRRRDGPLLGEDADRAGRPRAGAAPRDATSTAPITGGRSKAGGRRSTGAATAWSTSSGGSATASWRTACDTRRRSTRGGTLKVELDAAERRLRRAAPAPGGGPRARAGATGRHRVVLADADPRRWGPEAGTVTLRGCDAGPRRRSPGRWRLALHLADPSPRLRDDGRYAIRLANDGVSFDEAKRLERPGRGRGGPVGVPRAARVRPRAGRNGTSSAYEYNLKVSTRGLWRGRGRRAGRKPGRGAGFSPDRAAATVIHPNEGARSCVLG